jgi:hypothetical protein
MQLAKSSALIIVCIGAVSGCALFPKESEQAAKAAAKLVTSYCENTTPDIRASMRDAVNAKAAPHGIVVHCDGE